MKGYHSDSNTEKKNSLNHSIQDHGEAMRRPTQGAGMQTEDTESDFNEIITESPYF